MQVSPAGLATLLAYVSAEGAAGEATSTPGDTATHMTVERARSVRKKALTAVSVPQSIVDVLVDLRSFMQVPLFPFLRTLRAVHEQASAEISLRGTRLVHWLQVFQQCDWVAGALGMHLEQLACNPTHGCSEQCGICCAG
jgi:hypothetical protein